MIITIEGDFVFSTDHKNSWLIIGNRISMGCIAMRYRKSSMVLGSEILVADLD